MASVWDRLLPKSQAKQALLGGGFTLVLLGIAVLYGTADLRQCNAIVDSTRISVNVGAWRQAGEELAQAKQVCGGHRAGDIAELGARVAKVESDQKAADDRSAAAAASAKARAEDQLQAAYRVWAAYSTLPERNVEKLKAAFAEANTHADGLPEGYAKQIRDVNMALMRKNAAGLLKQSALSTGDDFTTFVPSQDPAECPSFAAEWLADPEALQKLGFRRIRCDGKRYKSTLTGEMVQEAARDWNVPER